MNEIDAYLQSYPPKIQAICGDLRRLVHEAVPNVQEALYRGWQLIGFRAPAGSKTRYFCFIAPHGDRVRLGLEWGVLLEDEGGILEDSGTQVRSLYFSSRADLQPDMIMATIREAAEVAALSKEQKTNLALQREAERESTNLSKRS